MVRLHKRQAEVIRAVHCDGCPPAARPLPCTPTTPSRAPHLSAPAACCSMAPWARAAISHTSCSMTGRRNCLWMNSFTTSSRLPSSPAGSEAARCFCSGGVMQGICESGSSSRTAHCSLQRIQCPHRTQPVDHHPSAPSVAPVARSMRLRAACALVKALPVQPLMYSWSRASTMRSLMAEVR